MIKYIRALFLLIPLNLYSMEQDQPIVLTGLRNVTHYIAVPCGLSKLKSLSPVTIEKKMFKQLEDIQQNEPSVADLVGSYPPVVKAWLTDRITCQTTREKALRHISIFHPIIRLAAETGFNATKAVEAFTRHQPTIDLFASCTQQATLALCANLNTELHEQLEKKFSKVFNIFSSHYISGNRSMLTTDPRFYTDIIEACGQDNCYFIDAEEETIAAACDAGIAIEQTLLYNCTDKDAPQTLEKFLSDHHLIDQQESLH